MTNPGNRIASRCSSGSPVAFRWFDGVKRSEPDQVEVAVQVCLEAIDGDTRVWSPYAKSMAKSEFKKRIQRAIQGELIPVEEVKGVDENAPPPLYEIRWQDVPVTDRAPDPPHGLVHNTVKVRMYHSEPTVLPGCFIGHHAHEKIISINGDTNDLQDIEITVAAKYYYLGEDCNWTAL